MVRLGPRQRAAAVAQLDRDQARAGLGPGRGDQVGDRLLGQVAEQEMPARRGTGWRGSMWSSESPTGGTIAKVSIAGPSARSGASSSSPSA